MLYLNSCLLTCFAVFGLVNPAWWQDDLKNGQNPWKQGASRTDPALRQSESEEDNCKCVFEYQCDKKTGTIITDGMGILGWRSTSKCPSDEVCCLLLEDEESTAKAESSTMDILDDENEAGFVDVPEEGPDSEPTSTSTSTVATGSGSTSHFVCGVANKASVELKVSGDADETETQPGNFPWTLVLKYLLPGASSNDVSAQVLLCGASLILPSVALTAAHCLDKKEPENIIVRAGEWDLASDDDDILFPQERRVKKLVIHPKYDLFTIKNDIAILFLDSPFESSPTINTICMPSIEEKIEWTTCYATGWGAKSDETLPSGDQTLKKALLPLVPRDQCEKKLRGTKLGGRFKLHKSFICAGGKNDVDTCKGDGGGPLACQANTPPYNFHLIGITSWGVGCAKIDVPGVYTDVTEMSDWVALEVQKMIESYEIPSQ